MMAFGVLSSLKKQLPIIFLEHSIVFKPFFKRSALIQKDTLFCLRVKNSGKPSCTQQSKHMTWSQWKEMSIRNILHNPQRVIWPYRKKGAQTRVTVLWRKQKRRKKKRKMTFNRIIQGTTTRSINMALLQAWQMHYIIKHEGGQICDKPLLLCALQFYNELT